MNPQSVYVDKLLTNLYLGYTNTELIADILFPKISVNQESGIYFKNDKSNLIRPDSTKRALNGHSNRITGKLMEDTYQLEEHTLEEWIDDRVLKTYDSPFNPRSNATNRIAGQLMIEKEQELINAINNSGSASLDAGGSWAAPATNLRAQVLVGKDTIHKATGKRPNVLVIDRLTYNALLENTLFAGAIAYTSDKSEANLRNMIASYFDIPRVEIAGGIVHDQAVDGTGDFLWSTKGQAILAYVNTAPVIEETSVGYQLVKNDMTYVDVRREEGAKSDVVRATDFYSMKIVDKDCMYLINDTITD